MPTKEVVPGQRPASRRLKTGTGEGGPDMGAVPELRKVKDSEPWLTPIFVLPPTGKQSLEEFIKGAKSELSIGGCYSGTPAVQVSSTGLDTWTVTEKHRLTSPFKLSLQKRMPPQSSLLFRARPGDRWHPAAGPASSAWPLPAPPCPVQGESGDVHMQGSALSLPGYPHLQGSQRTQPRTLVGLSKMTLRPASSFCDCR